MKIATEWLDRTYDYHRYYKQDSYYRVVSARLFQRTSPGCIAELSITVVDRRTEYYDKKDLMRE